MTGRGGRNDLGLKGHREWHSEGERQDLDLMSKGYKVPGQSSGSHFGTSLRDGRMFPPKANEISEL